MIFLHFWPIFGQNYFLPYNGKKYVRPSLLWPNLAHAFQTEHVQAFFLKSVPYVISFHALLPFLEKLWRHLWMAPESFQFHTDLWMTHLSLQNTDTDNQRVIIKVKDVNDEPPYFINRPLPMQAVVKLNAPPNTRVFTLQAKDPDTDHNIHYFLVRDRTGGRFEVDERSGNFKANYVLSYL